jgi:S-adenosylmethionine hydrolase
MESQATQFLDLYRTGVRTAADVMKASLESVEKIQTQQLQVFRMAMEENVKLMDYYGGVWRNAGTQVQGAMRDTGIASAANQEKRPEPQRRSA